VASGSLGPDGWIKSVNADQVWREHDVSDTDDANRNTKDGSFYSLKIDFDGASSAIQYQQVSAQSNEEWVYKLRGRTVTFGAWAKTSVGSLLRLGIHDGSWTNSSYHTADNTWQWLEMTTTIAVTATRVNVAIGNSGAGGIGYISQPMLVFGSSIGEGNYTRPQGEIVWCENGFDLTTYDEDNAISSNAEINLEAESNGKIPKGAKAVHSLLLGECSTVEGYLSLNFADSATSGWNPIYAQIADKKITGNFWQQCDSDGDIWIRRSHTFNDVLIRIDGVQLR
jgi:hypothetical protein